MAFVLKLAYSCTCSSQIIAKTPNVKITANACDHSLVELHVPGGGGGYGDVLDTPAPLIIFTQSR